MKKDYYKIVLEKTFNRYNLIEFGGTVDSISVFRCNKCNNTFKGTVHRLLRPNTNMKCPFCEGRHKNPSLEQIEYKINKTDSDYLLVEYSGGVSKKSKLLHKKCNNIWDIRLLSFFNGDRCPKCSHGSRRYTDTEIINMLPNNISLVQSYYSIICGKDHTHLFKCNVCNHEWSTRLSNITREFGSRCPQCIAAEKDSKAIKFIKNYLNDKKVDFIAEASFKDCRDKRLLKFDIYIKNINTIIEFDGAQHFDGNIFYKNTSQIYQNRDYIKNEYCITKNINLLRIPYTCKENSIKNILDELISTGIISRKTVVNYKLYYNNLNKNYYTSSAIKCSGK